MRLAAFLFASVAAIAHAQPDDATRREASERFERGLQLYDEGQYPAALAEFRRVQEIAPNPQVLYNLGRIHDRLGDAVAAVDHYERFLAAAGPPPARRVRTEVERSLERLRPRIATIRVECNVEGAVVTIGGADVATLPLAQPLRVNVGTVRLGVRAPGYETASREVEVAGGTDTQVRFELRPEVEARGTLRIQSALEAVEVRVDGTFAGQTPLPAPLPVAPGRRIVEGRRAGYLPARVEVDATDGVETDVSLTLARDPNAPEQALGTLRLVLPAAPATLRIDGERFEAGAPIELPPGPHRLRLDVAERASYRSRIDLPAGEETVLEPDLEWAPDARAERVAEATVRRTWGIATMVGGGAVTVASIVMFVWATGRYESPEARDRRRMLDSCDGDGTLRCSPDGPNMWDQGEEEEAEQQLADETNLFRAIAIAGAAVGVISLGIGTWIFLGSPTDEDIDAGARAHLDLGPDGAHLRLSGHF